MSGSSFFDLALTLFTLGLSAYAVGKVLNGTGRQRFFWLGFLCLVVGMLLGTLSWLTPQVPGIDPLTKPYVTGPLALIALILIVRNAPLSATSRER
jgi:hypothetical protein